MEKISHNQVEEWFRNNQFLMHYQLVNELKKLFPNMKNGTYYSALHLLKRDGLIRNVRRGLYAAGSKREFEPAVSKELSDLFKKLRKRFPYLDNLCVWDTKWLNEFTVQQTPASITIVEVLRGTEGAVFDFVKSSYSPVFLTPTPKEIDNYILGSRKCFVVMPLVSEAPVMSYDKITVPKLEKILVDLVCNRDLFVSFQGAELRNIYHKALADYNLSLSTIRRYAKRRGRLEEIDKLLLSQRESI
ncbi:MAG TPA: hypothetical protein PLA64_10755 [Mesotoga infera]|nr:hypothetical protein [Mesotoga infera]